MESQFEVVDEAQEGTPALCMEIARLRLNHLGPGHGFHRLLRSLPGRLRLSLEGQGLDEMVPSGVITAHAIRR